MNQNTTIAAQPDPRLDLAQRRRALSVNCAIYATRHLADAAALVVGHRVAAAAAARLAAGLAAEATGATS